MTTIKCIYSMMISKTNLYLAPIFRFNAQPISVVTIPTSFESLLLPEMNVKKSFIFLILYANTQPNMCLAHAFLNKMLVYETSIIHSKQKMLK